MDCFNVHNQLLSHNSKRSIKFLLCFSLLCVLFSSLPLLLQSLKPFLKQFDKSYVFLICNGLLVLIAMNSGLINAPSPPTRTTHQRIERAVPTEQSGLLESKEPGNDIAAPITAENVVEAEFPQEEEKILVIVEQENVLSDTQEEEGNALVFIDEDEDEHGVDDTEELNKKCEDFIKRMKATFSSNNLELRAVDGFYFDNQKSLVAVN
ncbi:hypothetical protein E2542_SST21976 [Spatholobus suberectus]|nr:hypothetical protein E2542_SST21976 [Spatholobus suberectus]